MVCHPCLPFQFYGPRYWSQCLLPPRVCIPRELKQRTGLGIKPTYTAAWDAGTSALSVVRYLLPKTCPLLVNYKHDASDLFNSLPPGTNFSFLVRAIHFQAWHLKEKALVTYKSLLTQQIWLTFLKHASAILAICTFTMSLVVSHYDCVKESLPD